MAIGFEQSKVAKGYIDDAFSHAAKAGSEIGKLEEKIQNMRESCAENIITRDYRDAVIEQCKDSEHRIRFTCRKWFEEQKDELEAKVRDAFALRMDMADPSKAAFLSACKLDEAEISKLTVEAMAASDATMVRMIASNAQKHDIVFTDPVPGYIDALLDAYETAYRYAENALTEENTQGYAQSLPDIYAMLDGLLEKAEARASVPCAGQH